MDGFSEHRLPMSPEVAIALGLRYHCPQRHPALVDAVVGPDDNREYHVLVPVPGVDAMTRLCVGPLSQRSRARLLERLGGSEPEAGETVWASIELDFVRADGQPRVSVDRFEPFEDATVKPVMKERAL